MAKLNWYCESVAPANLLFYLIHVAGGTTCLCFLEQHLKYCSWVAGANEGGLPSIPTGKLLPIKFGSDLIPAILLYWDRYDESFWDLNIKVSQCIQSFRKAVWKASSSAGIFLFFFSHLIFALFLASSFFFRLLDKSEWDAVYSRQSCSVRFISRADCSEVPSGF